MLIKRENTNYIEDPMLSVSVIESAVSPQFFSKSLTGNGIRKTGLLNKDFVPAKIDDPKLASPYSCKDAKATFTDGIASYELLPMYIAKYNDISPFIVESLPKDAYCISPDATEEMDKVYAYTFVHDMVLKSNPSRSGKDNIRTAFMTYEVWLIKAIDKNKYEVESTLYRALNAVDVLNTTKYSGLIDIAKLIMYFNRFTVYDLVCESAKIWRDHNIEFIKILVENNVPENVVICACRNLNNYPIGLTDYKTIYEYLSEQIPNVIKSVTEVNLNLQLNQLLDIVGNNKANVKMFDSVPGWQPGNIVLSTEQYRAVTSCYPYNMIQAGAGTGKSTVIRNRLEYMKACGVNMSKIMVLSFTNAAADHIKDIAPDVNSKTLAKMINDIYELNFPSHNLSTIDTVINLLESNELAASNTKKDRLVMALKIMKRDIYNGFIELSRFVHDYYYDVIGMLNSIGQTIFELQTIVCYHTQQLKEPDDICEHLIMDEVQDNNIFEFIFILNYVVRHNASLYLVGDGSQTLYEFRASDPRALNGLELSGVFNCFALQTNYRSNQNILDFANIFLSNIEANQSAKIQLHSNDICNEPFEDQVKVSYTQLNHRTKGLKEQCFQMLYSIKPWIDMRLARNEQIVFLSYRRAELQLFKEFVECVYPKKSYINIVPNKCFTNSFFSTYIRYFGDDYVHNIGADATTEITRHIIGNIDRIVYRDFQKDIVKQCIGEWANNTRRFAMVRDSMLQNGIISAEQFKADIFQKLIDFEVEKNAQKQALISSKNTTMKANDFSKFSFVACTIHSAKGLEFDNVILLYDEVRRLEEEYKRMYYVGMTRARKAEYILSYGTEQGSAIEGIYYAMREVEREHPSASVHVLHPVHMI